MADLSVQALVDAGAHIGCRVNRWNPKMEPFIYGSRNRIHIIDVRQTIRGILRASHFIREIVASGQDVLFVGTKPQIRGEIQRLHEQTGAPYVDDRWIGGTLTNYEIIGGRIAYLEDLEQKEGDGYLDRLTRKEAARFLREKRKVFRNLHGIRDMYRLPGAVVIVDPRVERNAVLEARKMGIPVVGVVDTDGDPDLCDIVIPANDDAIRSVAMILEHLSVAVQEGLRLRKERGIPEPRRLDPALPATPTPRPGRGGRGGPGRGGPGRGGPARGGPARGGPSRRPGLTSRRLPIQPVDPAPGEEERTVPEPRPTGAATAAPQGEVPVPQPKAASKPAGEETAAGADEKPQSAPAAESKPDEDSSKSTDS